MRLAMVMVVDGGGKGRRGGDEGEGAVGGRQKVDMVDMHGYGNAVGRRISCVRVCIPSPLSVLARRYLPLQSQAWGHHVEVFAYTDRDLSICTIIVGGTPSTEKRLYSLSVDVSVNTVMAGQGERPSGSNQLPAWAVCLLFTTTSWYSWT